MPRDQRKILHPSILAFNRPRHEIIPHEATTDPDKHVFVIFPDDLTPLHHGINA